MRLSFHQRILLILICLGAIPTAAAIVGWGLTIRAASPVAGPREALEEVGATGRALLRTLDTTDLGPEERAALGAHAATLNSAIGRFQRAETYGRYYYAGLGIAVFLLGAAALYASVRLGGHLSRQLSRPIEELIGWTVHIQRLEPLPPDLPRRGAPEFAALRTALREMAAAIDHGRAQEIEAERLRAFRETARRVAHEMRNPLTPIRLAVAQLARAPSPATQEAIDVLIAESGRLEQLAREFTEFGRLPEGPAAPVDLCELLEELVRTSVPPTMTARLTLDRETPVLQGHYDPLRRSFSKDQFVRDLQLLVPNVRSEDLVPGKRGVRAQAVAPDGKLLDDFHIVQGPRSLHVLNAPSPAATASIAIGRHLAGLVLDA